LFTSCGRRAVVDMWGEVLLGKGRVLGGFGFGACCMLALLVLA